MSQGNISINHLGLEESLNEIERIMKEINEDINNMHEAYNSLDKSYWIGPEKDQLDQKYGSILEETKNNTYNGLNQHLQLLRDAARIYREANRDIEKQSQDLEV